ncbi:MAG: response regulator [Nitrospirae bacterium]|nr:MAG: response regulator [Nitrospirota bacterium]
MARILVIDDDQRLRDLLHTVLQRKGHEVVLAENGSTGVERFRQERPDLTILDLNLPHLNGLAVLTQIRGIDPHAPVVILTGVGTETEEQQARVLGVSEVLRKGFSLHALGETLNRVLNQPPPPA